MSDATERAVDQVRELADRLALDMSQEDALEFYEYLAGEIEVCEEALRESME